MNETLLAVVTLLIMLVGMAGVIVPVLPDVWLIWLVALGYGLIAGFDGWVGGIAMFLLTLLALAGLVVDLTMSHAVAAKGGASPRAILASLGLGLVGLFFFPPIGPLVGAVLGLYLVEYFRHQRDARQAWRAVTSLAKGFGLSMLLRLGIAFAMILVWGGWVLAARAVGG